MNYTNPLQSLLGAFTPQQSDPYQSLLGNYYDPKREALAWLGGNLAGVGMGLASGRPGAWAVGGIQGGQNAIEDYRKGAVVANQIAQNNQDQQWQMQQRQDEAASKKQEADAQAAAIAGLPPGMQTMAKAFPNAVIPSYVQNKFFPTPVDNGDSWRYASPEEKKQLGVAPDAPLVITKSGPKLISTGAPTINVNSGDPPDAKLYGELAKNEAKTWGDYETAANVSAGNAQDFQVLDELSKVAPQGPVVGRAVQMFPGVSSSGAAFQSIVKRVAPTLRAPGSGSTSDVEYDGFLQSLPSLSNKPEANAVISQVMQRKAQINVERGDIVNKYQNGEISAVDARKQLAALNRKSILDPQLKAMIAATNGSNPTADDLVTKYATPQPQQ